MPKKPTPKKPTRKRKVAARRKPALKPVRFVAVERAFIPQIKVRALKDISGWVNRERRVKYSIGAGRIGHLDEPTAREWEVKGYVEIVEGKIKPVSEDEAAEFLSTVTVIGLGDTNG